MTSAEDMEMFTVYKNPRDAPGMIVVRRWTVMPMRAREKVYEGPSLEAAREAIPPKFDYCMPRMPGDDPAILETWM